MQGKGAGVDFTCLNSAPSNSILEEAVAAEVYHKPLEFHPRL